MKNIFSILILVAGIVFLAGCAKEEFDPKLDMSNAIKPAFTDPLNSTGFVLLQSNADDTMTVFKWSPTTYSLTNLESTKYELQMGVTGFGFVNYKVLASSTGTELPITVAGMNQLLLSLELETGVAHDIDFRIKSYINDGSNYSTIYSDVLTLTITPYADLVYIKPIYLLGSGTTVGWNNGAALPMAHLGQGRFARVEHLVPGTDQFIKFISVLTQWAPQWGTDAAGTAESGILVYRPDETVTDPVAIPVGTVEGDYYIEADTFNLTYKTFLTSGQLFLVGDATLAGWDNSAGLPFTAEAPHVFTITTTLTAGGGMKFLEVTGQWAPQWGTDENGNNEEGKLVYRPTESVPDPVNIPGPATAGTYKITVDLTTMMYTLTPQ